MRSKLSILWVFVLVLSWVSCSAENTEYTAVTVSDVKINIEDLNFLLIPLRQAELKVEMEAWLGLLQDKATEISQAEIALNQLARDIAATEGDTEALTKQKEAMIEQIAQLRRDRSAITDRCYAVVNELESKGGDVKNFKKYIYVVSEVKVDIKDPNAASKLILDWILSPTGGLKWGGRILAFIVTLIIFVILSAALGGLTKKAIALNKKMSDLLRTFFVGIVKKSIMIIGWVVAISMLGVNIGPLVAGIGAIGFIVGFALQGTLNNFAAGIMILSHKPYEVGDLVKTSGELGFVESMSLNTTTIKTLDNQIVVIPNGSIWGNVIINLTGSNIRRVDMTFGIGYADDIDKAQQILEDIVKNHELVLDAPAYTVKMHELGDSSVNFICRPWCKTSDYWTVYWDVTRAVKKRFDAEDVSIPFPQRDCHIYYETPEKTS